MITVKTTSITKDDIKDSKVNTFKDDASKEGFDYAVQELLNSKDFLEEYKIDLDLCILTLSTYDEGGAQTTIVTCDYPKTILQIDKEYRNKQDFFWRFH